MLTIGQLAAYVGVTTRTIRHYHQIGLLAEPPRDVSGYRTYGAQDVVDLQRIRILTDAGVPLGSVKKLLGAEPEELRAAVKEIDVVLQARIKELRATRRVLAELGAGDQPFLPPEVVEIDDKMEALGVSETTRKMNRDSWILLQVLFPDLMEQWHTIQLAMLEDPEYRDLYVLTDQALGWAPDDPRIEEVARRTVEWATRNTPQDVSDNDVDLTACHLATGYQRDASPGWERLMTRVQELVDEWGWATETEEARED